MQPISLFTPQWHRTSASVPQDGFEITRRGSAPVRTTIMMDMDILPTKFKLAPVLAETIGLSSASRADVVLSIWHYIKVRGFLALYTLDSPNNK